MHTSTHTQVETAFCHGWRLELSFHSTKPTSAYFTTTRRRHYVLDECKNHRKQAVQLFGKMLCTLLHMFENDYLIAVTSLYIKHIFSFNFKQTNN